MKLASFLCMLKEYWKIQEIAGTTVGTLKSNEVT